MTPVGLIHARPEVNLAADGDLNTYSILTPAYSDRPHAGVFRLSQPEVVRRIRVAKQGNTDTVGAKVDRMDLQILYTNDTRPLSRREFQPVDSLTNGFNGEEMIHADGIDATCATVDNDIHDFEKHGFYSLSFQPVEATAVAIRFSRDSADLEPWTHYPICEMEIHSVDGELALITEIEVLRAE